ncbi:ABC transporter permease [Vibrio salinus]|uniref:ABC transporter permease n=1 Tax=Vibrio salinus TaxID=2899784 RepID=UPI001E572126|nr:hypothetical protein [Vibrio salinus]MCE0496126.1 hypothetical protein [Vibrio salinus]
MNGISIKEKYAIKIIPRMPSIHLSRWLHGVLILLFALMIFGPILNLLIWTVAEVWYFPHSLPSQWGLKYWHQVFSPYSDVSGSLSTSVFIAVSTVMVCLLVSVPAGYALSKRSMPLRFLWMLLFLLPQAFPNLTVYVNIARIFYGLGLNGTFGGGAGSFGTWLDVFGMDLCGGFLKPGCIAGKGCEEFRCIRNVYVLENYVSSGVARCDCQWHFCFFLSLWMNFRNVFLSVLRMYIPCHYFCIYGEYGRELSDSINNSINSADTFCHFYVCSQPVYECQYAGENRQVESASQADSVLRLKPKEFVGRIPFTIPGHPAFKC